MEISKLPSDDGLEIRVTGRLDAYWADHLSSALEESVRDGAHRIRLHMAGISYMSSVGIRVLLRFHKQLNRINGSFAVSSPSEAVKSVLEMSGLQALLASAERIEVAEPIVAPRIFDRDGVAFEAFEPSPGSTLTCRVIGEPELLTGCRFGATSCRALKFPRSTIGIGLGALGSGFEDCQGRFGEFLAAAGAAAYLPTDGSQIPDYVVSTGAFVPELHVLYALACEGAFAHQLRFDTGAGGDRAKLSDLASACLDACGADVAAIVMLAESAGLLGAALRRSPVDGSPAAPLFAHPQIREWLSFTPERAHARCLALVVGVAARAAPDELHPLLRPLDRDTERTGHFHAAAFSYRPLPKGLIDLDSTVASVFESETLQGVLHLLADDRDIGGLGQSEFVRGACWTGAISKVVAARNAS